MVLAALTLPRHGYAIMREVEHRSEGEIVLQAGSLYRILKRFLRSGLIAEVPEPADADRDDERRRYYRITALGAAVATAEVERMTRLVSAASRTINDARAGRRRPGIA